MLFSRELIEVIRRLLNKEPELKCLLRRSEKLTSTGKDKDEAKRPKRGDTEV